MSTITHPYNLSVTEALLLIGKRKLSSREWITSCLERIKRRDSDVRAFVTINAQVLNEVEKRQGLALSPSIPIGVKDIIDVRGLPTMMGIAIPCLPETRMFSTILRADLRRVQLPPWPI